MPIITRNITAVMIGVLVTILIFWDVILASVFGNDATESRAMEQIGQEWPIVIFAWFGLGIHFFFPKHAEFFSWANLKPLVIALLAMISFSVMWRQAAN